MTTIAYKDGIIARDSRRLNSSGGIVSDNSEKMRIENDVIFFLFGCVCDYQFLIESYFGKIFESEINIEARSFVVDKLELFEISVFEGKLVKVPVMKNEPCAYGSGGEIAIGAMEMGASAAEAVEVAKRRDSQTGGDVRIFTIHEEPVSVF